MPDTTKTVEAKVETAVVQPVIEPTTDGSQDLAAVLAETNAELIKTREERENYKKGLLKAKGKLPDDGASVGDGTSETQEEMLRRIVREEQSRSKEALLEAKKDALTETLLKQNRELRLTIQGKASAGSGVVGGGQDKNDTKPTTEFFSATQLEEIKKKGLDPEKVKENLLKQVGIPRIVS